MHMADALLSPSVGAAFWALSAGTVFHSCSKLKALIDEHKIPFMGVLGAFIFAAQMINFTIPGTGSSGHLGGGMILAILLGPYAAFITVSSVLIIQAFFFADGGLLALGCNIFNMGILPCFIAYPLVYRHMIKRRFSSGMIGAASILSAIIALQLGAFSVVLQTVLSGKTELPFDSFILAMQPIHLAIGIVEGFITWGVINFVRQIRPEVFTSEGDPCLTGSVSVRPVLLSMLILAILTGGALSWFASTHPDGLEWSIEKAYGKPDLEARGDVQATLSTIQDKTAFLPDYDFRASAENGAAAAEQPESWPSVNSGTSVSGIVGAGLTAALAVLVGLLLRRLSAKAREPQR